MNTSRARTSIPVEFQVGENRGSGMIGNLGYGGLFIGTGTIPALGEPVHLRFSLGGSRIAVTGLVWWTRTPNRGAPGFGLRLLDDSAAYETAVEHLLA